MMEIMKERKTEENERKMSEKSTENKFRRLAHNYNFIGVRYIT